GIRDRNVTGVQTCALPISYVPIFADAHNQRSRFERYLEMLLEHHVEALIVVANWLFVDIQLLADLSKRNITAATIGWEVPGDSRSEEHTAELQSRFELVCR